MLRPVLIYVEEGLGRGGWGVKAISDWLEAGGGAKPFLYKEV